MSVAGFLNTNASRDYPLDTETPARLPLSVILDLGFVVVTPWGAQDRVELAQVEKIGSEIAFTFRATGAGIEEYTLTFQFPVSVTEFATAWAEGVPPLPLTGCPLAINDPAWTGFMTVGRLNDLATALLSGPIVCAPGAVPVVPSLVQAIGGTRLQSVSTATEDRTRWSPPPACGGTGEVPDRPILITGQCLAGDLELVPGYNLTMTQADRTATIVLSPQVGGGAGEPCSEIPLTPEEANLPPGTSLSGGPTCAGAVTRMNGLTGPSLQLRGGAGVRVTADPDDAHGLVVDVNLYDLAMRPR